MEALSGFEQADGLAHQIHGDYGDYGDLASECSLDDNEAY
jgi:hypothetical protein